MTNQLILKSGRTLVLIELRQHMTYEGHLEGWPTKEGNRRYLERIVKEEKRSDYNNQPYLISLTEKLIDMPQAKTYPFGIPAELPSVTCTGRFESFSPTTNGAGNASGLVIIWFQDTFQYPPPADIEASLESIDWDSYAGNFSD